MAEIIHDMAQLQRKQPTAQSDHDTDAAQLRDAIRGKLTYELGKNADTASDYDWYQATALAVRDRIVDRWLQHARRDQTAEEEARLLSVDRIPDRPAVVRHAHQFAPG